MDRTFLPSVYVQGVQMSNKSNLPLLLARPRGGRRCCRSCNCFYMEKKAINTRLNDKECIQKTHRMAFRLTDEEYQKVHIMMEKYGYKTVSTLMRDILLKKENARLTEENDVLRKRIASIDENAITRLRDKKDAEIKGLQERLGKAESEAVRSDNVVSRERQRADKAEGQIKEMLGIPEIKKIWETILQNKRDFNRQLNQWIDNALKAIAHFAAYEKNVHFSEQQSSAISMGIFAKAFKSGLDVTDNTARLKATQSLLDEVDWSEASNYKQGLTRHWTEMFSQDMPISQAIIETLTLAAGGRGGISIGGGGSSSELTNWDGTKKKTGWGM